MKNHQKSPKHKKSTKCQITKDEKCFILTWWFLVINHDQSWFPNSTWQRYLNTLVPRVYCQLELLIGTRESKDSRVWVRVQPSKDPWTHQNWPRGQSRPDYLWFLTSDLDKLRLILKLRRSSIGVHGYPRVQRRPVHESKKFIHIQWTAFF